MLKPSGNARVPTRLADMGVVRAQGADVVKFLQGQLSHDIARLTPDRSLLAGLHNPQGRAIALLRLVLAGPDEILALVPRELAAAVATRLGKYVLRAKVKISDVSSEREVAGVRVSDIAGEHAAASVGAARRDEEGRIWVCVAADVHSGGPAGSGLASSGLTSGRSAGAGPPGSGPAGYALTNSRPGASAGDAASGAAGSDAAEHEAVSRWLVVSKATPSSEPHGDEKEGALHVGSSMPHLTREEWRALDIAAGIPQVYAATSEAFVAQMLNLDLIDGISFEKGCYTGQEVIARAHYRGKVKRRMQRFRSIEPVTLHAGDAGTLSDGRSFKVVDAVTLNDGRSEFLAVAPVTTSSASDDEAHDSAGGAALNAEALPIPYSLPS